MILAVFYLEEKPMAYFSKEDIEKARDVDLLSYLRLKDPGSLVKNGYDTYSVREHDSLKINNGKWFWFSRGFGGVSALDYLIKVQNMDFTDAVGAVLEGSAIPKAQPVPPLAPKRELILPEKNNTTFRVEKYLRSRCIHPDVIRYCIDKGILYESAKYHNAVFIGRAEDETPKYAMLRSTFASFKGEAAGSDKSYSFRIAEDPKATDLHIFEAAIDLLSLASLFNSRGNDWLSHSYLSLGGISQSKSKSGLPKGLDRFLIAHPYIQTIHLHLDNDEPGKIAAATLIKMLSKQYTVLDEPPPLGKDINEYIVLKHQMELEREEDIER